jgi:DNA-directed RNA polymerase subunit RPC12/RpoP
LVKFKKDANSKASEFCNIVSEENRAKVIPNSTNCPFYLNQFTCYETGEIITKHEDVYWVPDKPDSDGIWRGLSIRGHKKQERKHKFEKEHVDTDNMVCPYCNHELSDSYDYELDEYNDNEVECPHCGQTFIATKDVTVTYSSRALKKKER